ncbi:S8 family peptidase [Virgibacillus proomii]|uniref:S8 family peptidase n=1 Tax=Virgibacillus proomii TaxID=84407 RepID=UPI001C11E58E|nr:S8 family serine peptidase [Virgibacillus proomii]MBU5267590.1 S8 family serine peptidase [Virgibacillus proomii]
MEVDGKMFKKSFIYMLIFSTILINSGCNNNTHDSNANAKYSKENINIAVIDSGINPTPNLENNIVETKSFVNENSDDLDHGTPISEIILSEENSYNKKISLYSYKVIDSKGKIDYKAFLESLDHLKKQGHIDVINISFGFRNDSSDIRYVINELVNQGVIIIASSGNTYGLNADYPARYPNVISVSSIDSDNNPLKFNAKGKIDFVAPGENINSISSKGGQSQYTGSSFATPYITSSVIKILDKKDIPRNKDRYKAVKKELQKISTNLGNSKIYGKGVPIKD